MAAPKQQKDNQLTESVPAARLETLLETSDQMLKSIFWGDCEKTLNTVTRLIRENLRAESCAIFLVPDENRDQLILKSSLSEKFGHKIYGNVPPIKIQSGKGTGLIGHIAKKGKRVNMSFTQMRQSRFYANTKPDYLTSGTCYSLLAIPLKDRKGRLVGVFKAENKQNSKGKSNEEIIFETVDEAIARLLANKLVIVLEILRLHDVFSNLIQVVHSGRNYNTVLDSILKEAVSFMNADRGDLALWSNQKRDLVIASIIGETAAHASTSGQPAHKSGMIRTFWENEDKRPIEILSDVAEASNYLDVNSQVKSEVVARLQLDENDIGVLNLESFTLSGFNAEDASNLLLISKYVSTAIQIADKQASLYRMPLQALSQMPVDAAANLSDTIFQEYIFDVIKKAGFERCRIYKFNSERRSFTCFASFPVEYVSRESFSTKNKYSEDMEMTFLNNKRARIYDPTDPRSSGPDPDAAAVGKPASLPWAAAPIIVNAELYGQIIADNAHSAKPITEMSIEYLNMVTVHVSRLLTQSHLSQLSILMESHPDHIYFKDTKNRFLVISQSLSEEFNLDNPRIAEGKTDFDYFELADAQKKFAVDSEIVKSGASDITGLEETNRFKNTELGDVRWVSTTKRPLINRDGNVIGTFGISRDITEQKKIKEALARANDELVRNKAELLKIKHDLNVQLASASKITHFGFWEWNLTLDRDGASIKATDEIFAIFNMVPTQEVLSIQRLREKVHPDDIQIWDSNVCFSAYKRMPISFEIRLKLPEGNIRKLSAKSELSESGDEAGHKIVMTLIQDITNLRTDKRLELGLKGFMHMIPGTAPEALDALDGLAKMTVGVHPNDAIAKARAFIFMILLKSEEVRSLFYDEIWFQAFRLDTLLNSAWAIATRLTRLDGTGLTIHYADPANSFEEVNGAVYTAAVNMLKNATQHGSEPYAVWVLKRTNKTGFDIELIFADGGPKAAVVKSDSKMDTGVGLILVETILRLANGLSRKVSKEQMLARFPDEAENIRVLNTFFSILIPLKQKPTN